MSTFPPIFKRQRRSGVALVMVLLIVVLLSVLVVSFFLDVRTETISADSYSERTKVRMLADSVQNLAVAQIQKATEGVAADGQIVAWASQPGMIRTWDDTGNPREAYKLYSSDQMVVDGTFSSESDILADVPTDWQSRPAEFTDLNSPVLVEDDEGTVSRPGDSRKYAAHFPIISGNNLVDGQYAGKAVKTYEAQIEGFGVETGWGSDGAIGPDSNPIPMPVRWLYLLRDGTLAPAGSGGSVIGAGEENPIVGRVAFWTDDDTCKLNINTASEGIFWDRPYTTARSEQDKGNNIPAMNEFATFPGHPATTSLSPVLGSLFPVPEWITTSNYTLLAPYYDLIPRVTAGGSKGGTIRPKAELDKISYDADRLYASVDEFIFKAQSTGSLREENDPAMDKRFLEQARFFLTAHSRAPEVNLFNLPRISLWPLDPDLQNAKDKLLAYCSTFNSLPYHFQRTVVPGKKPAASAFEDTSQSPNADWNKFPRNRQLYQYLQRLTSRNIPGLGGNLATKYAAYGSNARNQILTEMADFIRAGVNTTNSMTEPFYCFAPPKGVMGQGQVVPLMLDNSGNGVGTASEAATKGFGRFLTISDGALVLYNTNPVSGTGPAQDAPLRVKAVFVLGAFCPSPGLPSWSPNVQIRVKGLDRFEIDGKPLNLPSDATNVCNAFQSESLTTMNWGNIPPIFEPSGSTAYPATRLMFYYMRSGTVRWPKTVQFRQGSSSDASIYPFVSSADVQLSVMLKEPGKEATVPFRGGPVTVEVLDPKGNVIQSLELDFSSTNYKIYNQTLSSIVSIPVPEPSYSLGGDEGMGANVWPRAPESYGFRDFSNRIPNISQRFNMKNTLIRGVSRFEWFDLALANKLPDRVFATANTQGFNQRGDVVRGMMATTEAPLHGDLRALSLVLDDTSGSTSEPLFRRHPFYDINPYQPSSIQNARRWVGTGASDFQLFDPSTFSAFGNTSREAYAAKANYRYASSLREDENVFEGQFGPYAFVGNGMQVRGEYINTNPYRKGTLQTGGYLVAPKTPTTRVNRDAVHSVPFTLKGAFLGGKPGVYGDWDTGVGLLSDGPYINLPDLGNSATRIYTGLIAMTHGGVKRELYGGYYSRGEFDTEANGANASFTFSPNRQIASPVMFGSLSAGVDPSQPPRMEAWRTLLFCANPAAGSLHPGFGTSASGANPYPPYSTPPDHAFLDLFTMPIVEGYPISEPMSTAGKVNMNYQIAPFSYIRRSTAVRGVLKNVHLAALRSYVDMNGTPESSGVGVYKDMGNDDRAGWRQQPRYGINLDEANGTLRQFEQRFAKGDLFRSASEICDMFLVPKKITGAATGGLSYPSLADPNFPGQVDEEISFASNSVASWWKNQMLLTGDNLREGPYNHIYPRLTTKSNSYTVHVRIQSIKKNANTSPGRFVDPSNSGATDFVSGEFRGSFQVERYLDPNALNNSGIDFATASLDSPDTRLNRYYKYRTISSKEFKP